MHIPVSCPVRFLVEHGADIAAVNNEGELPLDLAEEDEMEEYLQDQLRKASEYICWLLQNIYSDSDSCQINTQKKCCVLFSRFKDLRLRFI